MAISQNFPNSRPSLNLNFARSKTLDPRITFSRTNPTATYVDDNGLIVAAGADEPRFDHDPTTGESLGLLVEEQRTNVLLYSEKIGGTFATYGWANQNSIAVQVDTADVSDPSGGNTASKLTNGSTSPVSQTLKTSSLSATVYTASVYLRTLSGTETASINVFLQSSPYTTIATSGEVTVTSEWQRFDITTSTATSANYNFGIQVRSGTIYAWGAQLEAGAFPTSYIPTSGSQANIRFPSNKSQGCCNNRWNKLLRFL
jgi:cell wall-associated NlpC family hydrolase